MSLIYVGMDTDKVAIDITKAYVEKLVAKIAELENANQSLGYECATLSRKVAELEREIGILKSLDFLTHKTECAESVAGIALRKLGDEKLWVNIARLNSLEFPEISANDYYPVGTILLLPKAKALKEPKT
jgi:hypothetical protein